MPDEYDDYRRGLTNYERGLYFELGRAHERGETPDRGWVRQFKIETGLGARILDNAKTEGRGTEAIERKSGRLNEVETRRQLRKERSTLGAGHLTRSRWETVVGEKIPATVRQDLAELARDFPDRFRHEPISRADALRAMELGRSLASQQLELIRSYELGRADRARKRLGHIREIARARTRAESLRRAQQFRDAVDRGRADARTHRTERTVRAREHDGRVRPGHDTAGTKGPSERARIQREAAERVAREFTPLDALVLGRDAGDTAERDGREVAEAREHQRQRDAADAAEKARKARELEEDRLRSRLPPHIVELVAKGRPTPGLESPFREPPEAGSTRAGRQAIGREFRGPERSPGR
ncbi:hypothetical protein BJY24_005727 [Nocardia transvalensis]|uniref:Uncharacterized protein n=1 Tax=Nocardia transvalensis TaxID=37333 RepID=A0A7W9ULK5_9NOCA|nr:hypothetical protein [Nocardia transvalensis]MBB5916815.1 hypothetical protein [Nocardia transvalensis]